MDLFLQKLLIVYDRILKIPMNLAKVCGTYRKMKLPEGSLSPVLKLRIVIHLTNPPISNRRDLRGYRIFTIDPPSAKDLDDALHITALEDGTFEIGVHIADVSFFVKEGSALDAEAKQRATSVYLVQKVIPMLPPVLCEQLCSLNPNVDRLAFSCIWRMNADGTLCEGHQPWFGRTVIRSCAKLDYPTAQRMVDGLIPNEPSSGISAEVVAGTSGLVDSEQNEDRFLDEMSEDIWERSRRPLLQVQQPPVAGPASGGKPQLWKMHKAWEISRDVCLMHKIAMSRREMRLCNGALVLHRKKLTFQLNSFGNPVSVGCYQIRQSNQLVEVHNPNIVIDLSILGYS